MVKLKFDNNQITELAEGINYAKAARGFEITDDGIFVDISKCDEGFCAKAENGYFSITYNKKFEFFRALAFICGKIEKGEKDFEINEKSELKLCCAMLDLSRSGVMTTKTLEDYIARLALMGMDSVMLYTEDTYELPGYPYFGYMRGKYTIEELKHIQVVCKAMGIELIPCIQTLAHLQSALRWEFAEDMMDTPDILLIGEEKTYEFIEAMFKVWREICDTDKIHIGMDEANAVGLGRYLGKHGYHDGFEIMSGHLQRVCEIAKKYGFEPMMWSDMFFRIASPINDYYDTNAVIPESLKAKIPDTVSMVYWDYYHEDKDFYVTMMKNHKIMCDRTLFAGGAWTWRGLAPLYQKTFDTTFPALEACRETGVDKIICTLWGDDGAEINIYTQLLGVQLFAEFNYAQTVSIEKLKENFNLIMGVDADDFLALDFDNIEAKKKDALATSKQVFYQDLLLDMFDKNFACYDLETYYKNKVARLEKVKDNGKFNQMFNYYLILAKLLEKKCTISNKLRTAYNKNDKNELLSLVKTFPELIKMYEAFNEELYILWNNTNKPFGYELFDERIGGMINRIKTAGRRITDYCEGRLDTIAEYDEELLWFGGETNAEMLLPNHFYADFHLLKRQDLF